MKEERPSGALPRSLDDRDEDGGQFVALGTKGLQLVRWHDFSIDEEFQPIRGFFQLPQQVAAFGDELGFAPSAMSFPIVRPDGCSRAEQLFAQHLSLRRFRQTSEQADDSQRKLFGVVLEVVFFLHNSDLALHSCRRSRRRGRRCGPPSAHGRRFRPCTRPGPPGRRPRNRPGRRRAWRGAPRRCRRCT